MTDKATEQEAIEIIRAHNEMKRPMESGYMVPVYKGFRLKDRLSAFYSKHSVRARRALSK